VKGCRAALAALLLSILPAVNAADDLNGAVRELARKAAAFAGASQPVSVEWRNLSSLGPADLAQARTAFESALRQGGIRMGETEPAAGVRLTLSENPSQYLLVGEGRKGEEHQVWIAAWNRRGPAAVSAPGMSLERKLVWEQDESILDIAFPAAGMLVLSPARVALYTRQGGTWEQRAAVQFAPLRPWPRDVRGRLHLDGTAFQAFLPGMTCTGDLTPALSMECRPGNAPWVLESGGGTRLAAGFEATRNYFNGTVIAGTGRGFTVAPFFSAAAIDERGRTLWLLATLDGRTHLFDAEFKPACQDSRAACGDGIANWGSDIAATSARCGGGRQVLATRSGDAEGPDALQAFAIVNRAPEALTPPAAFGGPVTALWPLDGESALCVTRDLASGRYRAYVVTVDCGS
jgi:hypothetical protein